MAKKKFSSEQVVAMLRQIDVLTDEGKTISQAARVAKRNRSDFYSLLNRHEIEPRSFKS